MKRGSTRCWTLRYDNNAHHHGVVDLAESPLTLEMNWRKSKGDPAKPVGTYVLDLPELLRDGYIRYEPDGNPGSKVRLRIVMDSDTHLYVQVNSSSPRLRLGN